MLLYRLYIRFDVCEIFIEIALEYLQSTNISIILKSGLRFSLSMSKLAI